MTFLCLILTFFTSAQVDYTENYSRDRFQGTDEPTQIRADFEIQKSGFVALSIDPWCTPQLVGYRVHGPVKNWRIKDEHTPAVGDLNGLITSITEYATSDREKAELIYYFVVEEMRDWYFPAQGIDLTVEDLNVLIWGFGYGFCYDLSRLMVGLWDRAGLRGRIVAWPRHTLAEVYYDGDWHMYDAQHRMFYLNEQNQVASFALLKTNPSILAQQLDAVGHDPIGYPPEYLATVFQQADPSYADSVNGPSWKDTHSYSLNLRENEWFDIVYTEPAIIYHPDSWAQFYGEMTLRKEPPWPVLGRQQFRPEDKRAWQSTTSPEGADALALNMESPFIFTEGWITIPNLTAKARFWIEVWGQTTLVGQFEAGKALFSKQIAGCNTFKVIVENNPQSPIDVSQTQIETRLQISHIGVPKLRPGLNQVQAQFESGNPSLSLWYLADAPDLRIDGFRCVPERPKNKQVCQLIYRIRNRGSGQSPATTLNVFNNTTALRAETIEKVGTAHIPPLEPGGQAEVTVYWEANQRMTWYKQDPHAQIIDAWIDIEKNSPDCNRDNNRRQDHVLLLP